MGKFRDIQEFVRLSRDSKDLDALRNTDRGHDAHVRVPLLPDFAPCQRARPPTWSSFRTTPKTGATRCVKSRISRPIRWCGHVRRRRCRFSGRSSAGSFRYRRRKKRYFKARPARGSGRAFPFPFTFPESAPAQDRSRVASGRSLDEETVPSVNYVAAFAFEAARRLLLRADKLNFDVDSVPGLTERQLDCIVLMAQGKSDWTQAESWVSASARSRNTSTLRGGAMAWIARPTHRACALRQPDRLPRPDSPLM